MTTLEPTPPARKQESFPKTNTMPAGWNGETLLAANEAKAEAAAQSGARPTPQVDDERLFTRCLEPFPKPNTIPNGWDLSEYLV